MLFTLLVGSEIIILAPWGHGFISTKSTALPLLAPLPPHENVMPCQMREIKHTMPQVHAIGHIKRDRTSSMHDVESITGHVELRRCNANRVPEDTNKRDLGPSVIQRDDDLFAPTHSTFFLMQANPVVS
jgi:hypothetical protein